jgi:hypothetical protein
LIVPVLIMSGSAAMSCAAPIVLRAPPVLPNVVAVQRSPITYSIETTTNRDDVLCDRDRYTCVAGLDAQIHRALPELLDQSFLRASDTADLRAAFEAIEVVAVYTQSSQLGVRWQFSVRDRTGVALLRVTDTTFVPGSAWGYAGFPSLETLEEAILERIRVALREVALCDRSPILCQRINAGTRTPTPQ